MSKLQELIRELCPNGVEYKTIRETVGVNRGKRLTKRQLSDDGKYEVYHGSKDSILGKYAEFNAPENTVIIINTGGIGGVKFLDRPFWCSDGSFWLGQAKYVNPKFLYYYLSGYEDFFYSQRRVGGVPTIDRSVIEKFEIPIPPPEVQGEIVKILDHFTDLAAELQAELQARKEQYEYYRNKLLTFVKIGAQSVTWMRMCDLFDMRNGYTPSKTNVEYWENGTVPWFRMEDIRQNGRILSDSIQHITSSAVKGGRLFPANSFIIATTATIGEHALIIADSLANQQFTNLQVRKSLIDKVNIKFLYYYMYIVGAWCKNNTNVSGFASVDMKKFKKLLIPIPSISKQQRIVAILDKFEVLVNDLSQGLPAEVAAVQEQYEYYRNKLLSFSRADMSA